jgi:sialate O-acetylesterase
MKVYLLTRKTTVASVLVVLLLSAGQVLAEVKLASPFTDHMVLQRGMKVPVWGTADSGEKVSVEFAGQKQSVKADADGKWRINLDSMRASDKGRTLIVTGSATKATIKCEDVLVGEVWLCSGQSNMDFTVAKTTKYYFAGVTNEEQEVAAANYPNIRMFSGAWQRNYEPQTRIEGIWKICTPENVKEFSAIGYFFARDLQKELNAPVGILTETFGASTAEAWVSREALAAVPDLKPMLDRFDTNVAAFKANPPDMTAALKTWEAAAAKAKADGTATPRRPGDRNPTQDQHNPTVMYNGMIAPIIPYAIKGVLWYQGESIVGGANGITLYPLVQSTLIKDWRQRWGEGDFPFYICQLAAHKANSNNPGVREAQATVLAIPNTGMAVSIDIGDPGNVHPKNKQDVGWRLMRIALAKAYGRKVEYSGPRYESMKVEGHAIRLKFTHNAGLTARGGDLKTFTIAGKDGKFVTALAKIEKGTVVVSSPEVAEPAAVRYAWENYPEGCNLYNRDGLPAAPFRTDSK